MSWDPQKNHLSRRPTSALPLLSHAENRDLDIAVEKLIYLEGTIRILTKEIKRYLEAVANLDRADQRLTQNLESCGLSNTNEEFRNVFLAYQSVTKQVGMTIQNMADHYQKILIEPLKKLRAEFARIAAAIAKREELVTNWKYSYNRMKKLEEKNDRTASHIAKLERERRTEEADAKDLKIHHTQLLVDLPSFLDKRIEYINPSVQAMNMIQLNYYRSTTNLFGQLMPLPNISESPSSAMISQQEYQQSIDAQMNRIKALTIVKNR